MRIIDNFLNNDEYIHLNNSIFTNSKFTWNYSETKTAYSADKLYNQQMVHTLFNSTYKDYHKRPYISEHFHLMDPFLDLLNCYSVLRIKINLTMPAPSIQNYDMHRDLLSCPVNYKTAIYYLNTNDGKTIFETGETVDSVGNRMVIFNGNIAHTGTTHTNTKFRSVINFNYISLV